MMEDLNINDKINDQENSDIKNNKDDPRIMLREMHLALTDIDAAKALFTKYNRNHNRNLLCMIGYHCGQCVEKSLKTLIELKDSKYYNIKNEKGTRKIRENHDIRKLMDKVENLCPGFEKNNRSVSINADKFRNFNNLPYGRNSMTYDEASYLMSAAIKMYECVNAEIMKNFENENVDSYLKENYNRRQDVGIIGVDKTTVEIAEIRNADVNRKAIDINSLEVLRAFVESGDALIERYDEKGNDELLCLAARNYIETIRESYKAMIKADDEQLYYKKNPKKEYVVQYSHNMSFLLECLEKCRPGEMQINLFTAKNAIPMTVSNKLRYGKRKITMEEVSLLENEAKRILNRLEKDFERDNPDQKKVKEDSDKNWDIRFKSNLKMPPKKKDTVIKE